MILALDHVAVVVPDLTEALRRFTEDLGLPLAGTEDVATALTRTAFVPVAGPTALELVTPLPDALGRGQGPLVKHLETRGPGLHHLCFRVSGLDEMVSRLRERGYRFTTDAPYPGAHGCRVIFVHPKSGGGVLIELSEPGSHP